jgi:hypothetical protein
VPPREGCRREHPKKRPIVDESATNKFARSKFNLVLEKTA